MDKYKDFDDELRRAYAAYFRDKANTQQPSTADSGVTSIGELHYVVLRNTSDVLAVYRIRNDGMLKKMRRITADQMQHFSTW